MSENKNWWWPEITDLGSAIEASKNGFWAAIIVGSVTAAFATYAVIANDSILGVNIWAYLDSLLFFIIAWRIKRYSKMFSVTGLMLFIFERVMLIQSQGAQAVQGIVLGVILLLMFITGVRGVFAYHRFFGHIEEPKEL